MDANGRRRWALLAATVAVGGGLTYWLATRDSASLAPDVARLPTTEPARQGGSVPDEPPPVVDAEAGPAAPPAPQALSHVALLLFTVGDEGAADEVALVSVQPRARRAPAQHDMPLAEGRLAVALEDRERRELWRTVIADPRVVRGEFFDAQGVIEQSVNVRRDGAASILFPQHDDAYRLTVAQAVRETDQIELRPLAALDLR